MTLLIYLELILIDYHMGYISDSEHATLFVIGIFVWIIHCYVDGINHINK